MIDHISSILEAQFPRQVSMDSSMSESMKMALLMASLSNLPQYSSIVEPVNILQRELALWNCVSMLFIE